MNTMLLKHLDNAHKIRMYQLNDWNGCRIKSEVLDGRNIDHYEVTVSNYLRTIILNALKDSREWKHFSEENIWINQTNQIKSEEYK